MRTARRLHGFVPDLARLAGTTPAALRGRPAFQAACSAVADADAAGPARVRSVREGRRTVGHALASDADVRLLAAAILRHRTLDGLLDGSLVPKVARVAGIRGVFRRTWSSDPHLDGMAREAVDAVHLRFGVRCILAGPGAAWVSALVVPRLHHRPRVEPAALPAGIPEVDADWFGEDDGPPIHPAPRQLPAGGAPPGPEVGERPDFRIVDMDEMESQPRPYPQPGMVGTRERRVEAIVLLRSEEIRSLLFSDLPGTGATAAGEAEETDLLRAAIDDAVRAGSPAPPGHPTPQVDTGFEEGLSAVMLAEAGFCGLPRKLGERVSAALPHQLARRAWSSSAIFRRTLPPELSDLAGLLGNCFDGPSMACRFLRMHEGFTPRDNARVLEAMRMMTRLLPHHGQQEVLDALRLGGSLDEALAKAVRRPVRPKTAKSLRSNFPSRMSAQAQTMDTDLLCRGLDAYFSADPHRPALDRKQAEAALRTLQLFLRIPQAAGRVPDAVLGAAVAAHRDAGGRIRPPSLGEGDLFGWVAERCRIAFGTGRLTGYGNHGSVHLVQASEILYPPQRRAEALERLNASWHRDVVRLSHEHDTFLAGLVRGRKAARAPAPSFPHLMDAPVEVDGVVLTPLRGPDAIAAEGRDLGHCIGTYVGQASTGQSILIGLSSEGGRSSVELRPSLREGGGAKASLRLSQHYGPRNGSPPPGHPEALASWLESRDPKAILAVARIAAEADRQFRGRFDPYAGIGREGRRRLAEFALAQLAPYLWGDLKRRTREEWMRP